MEPQLFYGRSNKDPQNIQIREICGYESEDPDLLSESDEELFEMNNDNVIVPGGDNVGENITEHVEEDNIQDENIDDNTRNVQDTGLVWKKLTNRSTCQVYPWKGSLHLDQKFHTPL